MLEGGRERESEADWKLGWLGWLSIVPKLGRSGIRFGDNFTADCDQISIIMSLRHTKFTNHDQQIIAAP